MNTPLKYGLIPEKSHSVAYAFDMGPQMVYTSAYPSNVFVPLVSSNSNNNPRNFMDSSSLGGYNNNLPPSYGQQKTGVMSNGAYPDYINSSMSHIPLPPLQMDNMHSVNMAAFGENYQLYVPQYHGNAAGASAASAPNAPYYYQQPRPPHLNINANFAGNANAVHHVTQHNHPHSAMMYAQHAAAATSGMQGGYSEDDIFEKFRPPTLRISK